MRVLHFVSLPTHLEKSGAFNAAASLAEAQADAGITADVAVMGRKGVRPPVLGARVGDPRYHSVPLLVPFMDRWPRVARSLFQAPSLREIIARLRPEVVHLHNPIPAVGLFSAVVQARQAGCVTVVHTHGLAEVLDVSGGYRLGRLTGKLAKALVTEPALAAFRTADAVFCLSPHDVNALAAHGVPRSKMSIVSNGFDPGVTRASKDDGRAWLESRLGMQPGDQVVGFLGNHTRNKGIDLVLGCAERLPEVTFAVGGRKRGLDGLTLSRNVWFSDLLGDDEVSLFYAACDVFLFPTRADTLPLAVLDAMASGTPVVSSRVGGIPWMLGAGYPFLSQPGDLGAFTANTSELLRNPAQRGEWGRYLRERAASEFSWVSAASESLARYTRLLEDRS